MGALPRIDRDVLGTIPCAITHLLAVDRQAYADAKGPFVSVTIRRAEQGATIVTEPETRP